ncbi:MAG TPA: 30S ribosomal protein S14 [Rickettsiales bacterium]|nr:30S ribosomal protein S14 [Rickettsiales bacterium]
MAKKCLKIRNERREKLARIQGAKRVKLKEIAKDNDASFEERIEAQTKLSQMPRDGSYIRYRNRCKLSGRPRGNLRKFGLSRIAVRELASWGQIPGLVKSSW